MPTNVLHHPGIYNIKRINTLQAESKITSATIRLNSFKLAHNLFIQQIVECQLTEWLPDNPLARPTQSTNRKNTQIVSGLSQILKEQGLQLKIPKYPIQKHNGEWIGDHTSPTEYKKMRPYLKRQNILFCHQTRGDLTPRRLLSTFWDLRLVNRPPKEEAAQTPNWASYQNTGNTIDIYTDGAIDQEQHDHRKKGISIAYSGTTPPIVANAPIAKDSTQTELQAICLAILTSPSNQSIRLHTDSSRAIHAVQTKAQTAKQQVRRAYSTELKLIQETIQKEKLKVEWIKVKAHSNNKQNDQADELAKKGKTSSMAFRIKIRNLTIIDD